MKKSRAFTLIEVMVALFILAITFIGVIGTSSHVSHAVTSLEEKTVALWVAQNAMAEISLGLSDRGTMTMLSKRWEWTSEKTAEDQYERVNVKTGNTTLDFFYYKPPPIHQENLPPVNDDDSQGEGEK
jgi:general secretion pathway protein I